MVPPVSSTKAADARHERSRPTSKRVLPSAASRRSTTFWVAMPA
jgi:hypothetical protein